MRWSKIDVTIVQKGRLVAQKSMRQLFKHVNNIFCATLNKCQDYAVSIPPFTTSFFFRTPHVKAVTNGRIDSNTQQP